MNLMMGTVYTSKLDGIPRRQENDTSGYGGLFFLTFGFKDASSHKLSHQIEEAVHIVENGQGVYIDAIVQFMAPQFTGDEGIDLAGC